MNAAAHVVVALTIFGAVHGYKDAVFIGNTKSVDAASYQQILFDHEEEDFRNSYDTRGGQFYAYKAGVYWTAMSLGAMSAKPVAIELRNYGNASITTLWHTKYNGIDTRSRDMMMSLGTLEAAYVLNYFSPAQIFSDTGLQTSLCLFRLTDLMSTEIMFSVSRDSSFEASADALLPFDRIYVNEGNAFNKTTSIFKVPIAGYYFISYSGYPRNGSKFDIELCRNTGFLSSLESQSTSTNYDQSFSRGGLFHLHQGDNVFLKINKPTFTFDDNRYPFTSFSAFLYDPVHGIHRAWSVAKTSSWSGRKLSPIPFEKVLINLGSNWDALTHAYVVSVTGFYYITYTVGAQAFKPVEVNLMVDDQEKASLLRTSTVHNGMELMSRSAILNLSKGNRVCLEAGSRTAFYSDVEMQTTFTGIFLFPLS